MACASFALTWSGPALAEEPGAEAAPAASAPAEGPPSTPPGAPPGAPPAAPQHPAEAAPPAPPPQDGKDATAVPPPVVPVPATPAPRPDDVFSGRPADDGGRPPPEEHSWFDAGHAFVGRIFFAPTVRLDRFFSDETDLDPERAQSFARLRTGLRLRQDGKPQASVDLVADIKLPGVNHWLGRSRLVFTGESDSENDALNPSGSTTPFTSRERNRPSLEFRFGAYHGIRSSVDLGAGVMFRLPPGAFSRVRYRLAVPIDDVMLARFSTQVFWRTDMHLGTRASSALDWPFGSSTMLRLGAASQVAQRRTRGIEYGTELVLAHAFSPTFAVALGTDAQGSVKDPVLFQKYRIFTRFRHDVLRRWLFLEAEPELGWPWTPLRGRYRAYAVILRLEVQFEGDRAVEAQARPPPPAPGVGD
jgi:hypothetical protein